MGRLITVDERRARLGHRHRLVDGASGALEVTRSLVALHSSDPSTVYLSVWARAPDVSPDEVSAVLYEERSLVRVYGMRRTLWVVDRATHPEVEHSSTVAITQGERRRMVKMLEDGGVTDDGDAWLEEVLARVEHAIAEDGPVLARDLTKRIPELSEKLTFYNKQGRLVGTVGISTRALVQLALESRIIRAEPVGTWISSQYRWSGLEKWLGGPIPDIDPNEARAGLLRKWLARFGPATEIDMKWWTGWTVRDTRRALTDIGAVEVTLDDDIGFVNEDDLDRPEPSPPWVALLPSLDPTTMGWKERGWYLGNHAGELFDRNGNAGPTVWADGRVVGGWTQRKSGELAYGLLEDVGPETVEAIETKLVALQEWLGDIVITPRFRSPFDKTLAS